MPDNAIPPLHLYYDGDALCLFDDDNGDEYFSVLLPPNVAGAIAHGIVHAFGTKRVTIHPQSDAMPSLAQQSGEPIVPFPYDPLP